MARYGVRWLEIADATYRDLPAEIRKEIDRRLDELAEYPEAPAAAYDPRSDQWTTTYGGGRGLIVYAVAREQHRLLILRLL